MALFERYMRSIPDLILVHTVRLKGHNNEYGMLG